MPFYASILLCQCTELVLQVVPVKLMEYARGRLSHLSNSCADFGKLYSHGLWSTVGALNLGYVKSQSLA